MSRLHASRDEFAGLDAKKSAARDAAAEADPSLREARDDELATKRAQERMDLRHASTSAWARSTKMRGRGAVESRRREMRDNEALRRELAKKQEQSSSDEESDDESREELIAKARASLGECVDEEEPGSALLNMKFMAKAREAQRARAREDAEKLLEELEAENSSSDDDDGDGAALRELAALSGDRTVLESPHASTAVVACCLLLLQGALPVGTSRAQARQAKQLGVVTLVVLALNTIFGLGLAVDIGVV